MRGIRPHDRHRVPAFLGESFKIVAMGVLLALLLFVFVFYQPGSSSVEQPENPISEASVVIPVLDPEIMALALDETRPQRLRRDREPFRHLLEASLNVVPAVARKLGMPLLPLDIAQLRATPRSHRGKYLWLIGWFMGTFMQVPT